MSANNLVNLIGFLGRDPDIKPVGDVTKASFSIGVNGYKKDQVNWFNIEAWDRLGTFAENYLKKGTQIAVSGSLKEERWEKDGERRSRIVVVAEDIRFVGGGGSKKSEDSEDEAYDEDAVF